MPFVKMGQKGVCLMGFMWVMTEHYYLTFFCLWFFIFQFVSCCSECSQVHSQHSLTEFPNFVPIVSIPFLVIKVMWEIIVTSDQYQ